MTNVKANTEWNLSFHNQKLSLLSNNGQGLAKLDSSQFESESLFYQGPALSGRARQGIILANWTGMRVKTDWFGF